MTASSSGSSASVVDGARSVFEAGRQLRQFLGQDAALSFAVDALERAVDEQETGVDGALRFGFSQLDQDVSAPSEAPRDLLLTTLAELDIANVLLAAAQATGDGVAAPGDPDTLDEALARLDAGMSTLAGEGTVDRFGFGEPVPVQDEPASADLAAAVARMRSRVDDVLGTLLRETEHVVQRIATVAGELAPEKVRDAVRRLGEAMPALPKVGRLALRALRKIERALEALGRLLHLDVAARVREEAVDLWSHVKDGSALAPLLRRVYGEDDTRRLLDEIIGRATDPAALDAVSRELSSLVGGFAAIGETLARHVTAIGNIGGALFIVSKLFPVLEPFVVPTTALACALVLGVVVVLGMDYADAGVDRGEVAGMRVLLGRL